MLVFSVTAKLLYLFFSVNCEYNFRLQRFVCSKRLNDRCSVLVVEKAVCVLKSTEHEVTSIKKNNFTEDGLPCEQYSDKLFLGRCFPDERT